MKIPYQQLSPQALDAIVLEFVTRDGTDHSSVEKRVESVMRQLKSGKAQLHFDLDTETCQIVMVD